MEMLERVSLVAGILAALGSGFSFILGLPKPFNFAFGTLGVCLLGIATLWHLSLRKKISSSEKRVLLKRNFVLEPNESESFRLPCKRAELLTLSLRANAPFNWYLLDSPNVEKYKAKRARFESEHQGLGTLREEKEFKVRKNGVLHLVVENSKGDSIQVDSIVATEQAPV